MPPSNEDRCEAVVGAHGGRCLFIWHKWYQVQPAPAPHMTDGQAGYSGPMALCSVHLRVARGGKRALYLADPHHRAMGSSGGGKPAWRPGPPPSRMVEGHPEYRKEAPTVKLTAP